jgi:GR25 family glycosyltransferase involved in LPS biosynthesis
MQRDIDNDINYFNQLFKLKKYKEICSEFKDFEEIIFSNSELILNYFVSLFYLQEFEKCIKVLKQLKFVGNINCFLVEQTFYLLPYLIRNKKLIGTYNKNRQAQDDEIVIKLGDYPIGYESLFIHNTIKLNYKYAFKFKYNIFEGEECWDKVDKIFIINLFEREDRLFDILREFKKLGIPLTKVEKIEAERYHPKETQEERYHPKGTQENGYLEDKNITQYLKGSIGCSLSHLKVINKIIEQKYNNCLIFEDDFTFTEDINQIKEDITLFFDRNYKYDISLLAYSYQGKIEKLDDLLSNSFQHCTTASGYFISLEGANKLKKIWTEGLQLLIETGDVENYACDIYWKEIQKDNKMFLFNNKIGYQKPSISQITGICTYNLD